MSKLLLPILVVGGLHIVSQAAVSGTGTPEDSQTGTAAVGDIIYPDVYVKNLTEVDGTEIILSGLYTPRHYGVHFLTAGGMFPDGSTGTVLEQVYGEIVELPEDPVREDKWFAGWYMKGNRQQEISPEENAELLSDTVVYLLASDDPADLAGAEPDEEGRPTAKALWRTNVIPESGQGISPGQDPGAADLWDEEHFNNHVIEWIRDLPEENDYRLQHGKTAFQYGRVTLDAETDEAVSYTWYVKRRNDQDYLRLEENSARLTLSGLRREDHDSCYRCVVSVGTREEHISYETKLTVFWLPEISGISVRADGKEALYAET